MREGLLYDAGDIVQGRAKRMIAFWITKQLKLWVGEREIVIVPFVQKLLQDSVCSFVNNIKDVDPAGKIKLRLRR